MAHKLTPVQRQYVEFVRDFRKEHEVGPSLRDIQDHVGPASLSTIKHTVDVLVDVGALKRTPGVHRSLRLG